MIKMQKSKINHLNNKELRLTLKFFQQLILRQ